MNKQEFLFWEMASNDSIDFKKMYVDVADDLIAGLLLSQIVYWHLPSKETGKTKLRVEKEGHLWLAKERSEWYDEIRISIKQYGRAIKILEDKKIVELKKFKFNGMPTVHIRILWDNFLNLLEKLKEKTAENIEKNEVEPYSPMGSDERDFPETPKGTFPKGQKVTSGKDERSLLLTESTDIDYPTENLRPFVNKEKIINIANNYYSDFAIGRWSKETWIKIVEKMTNDILQNVDVSKIYSLESYIKNTLENIAYSSDLKNDRIQEVHPSLSDFNDFLNR